MEYLLVKGPIKTYPSELKNEVSLSILMKRVVLGIFFLFLGSCSGLFYQPQEGRILTPEDFGYQIKWMAFENQFGTHLTGWWFKSRQLPAKAVVIQFHGNAQNMSTHFLSLAWMIDHGYHFVTFDYSGYGLSEGEPSQEDLYQDALAVYQEVRSQFPGLPIILVGQSLGAAVLARSLEDMTPKDPILAVILDSGFDSYQAIARDRVSDFWLTWPLQFLVPVLVSDQYSPEQSIAKISPIPLLVIHAEKDPVVPYHFGQRIHELARQPKTFWSIASNQHIAAFHQPDIRSDFVDYLDRLLQTYPRSPKNYQPSSFHMEVPRAQGNE